MSIKIATTIPLAPCNGYDLNGQGDDHTRLCEEWDSERGTDQLAVVHFHPHLVVRGVGPHEADKGLLRIGQAADHPLTSTEIRVVVHPLPLFQAEELTPGGVEQVVPARRETARH